MASPENRDVVNEESHSPPSPHDAQVDVHPTSNIYSCSAFSVPESGTMASAAQVQTLDLSQVHPQTQSPLYTTFPTEMRLAIYALVLASFPDPNEPYPFMSYYYRPGYTAPMKNDLRLLRVCKQVYIEAKGLIWDPTSGRTEEAFWWGDHRRRPLDHRQRRRKSSTLSFTVMMSDESQLCSWCRA